MRSLIALALVSLLSVPAATVAAESKTQPQTNSATRAQDLRISASSLSFGSLDVSSSSGALLVSGLREGSRLANAPQLRFQEPAAQARKPKNWISRHPALFGALVGAGAGALASGTMENELFCSGGDEDCFFHGGSRILVGAGMGAGVGALIGWIGSL